MSISSASSLRFALLLMMPMAGPSFAFKGTVRYEAFAGAPWNIAPSNYRVKFCNIAYAGAWSGEGYCFVTSTDSYGNFVLNVPTGSYATFAWYNNTVGSDSSAAWGAIQDFSGNWYQGNQLN